MATSLDELALEFDDHYQPLKASLAKLVNGAELTAICQTIEAAFTSETLGWTFDDLYSPAWNNIRQLADDARALVEISLDVSK